MAQSRPVVGILWMLVTGLLFVGMTADGEAFEKLMRLVEVLEDDDDVQNVTTNVEASEDVMAAYAAS